MLTYSRFWHFWSTSDSRHYSHVATITAAFAMTTCAPFLSLLWTTVASITSDTSILLLMHGLAKLSDFMFARRNRQLQRLKKDVTLNDTASTNAQFNQLIDFYINQRIVFPKELLTGQWSNLSKGVKKETVNHGSITKPLSLEQDTTLKITTKESDHRNTGYTAISQHNDKLFIKETTTMDALSEIAAREMAELTGFRGLIPSNTVAKKCVLDEGLHQESTQFFYSRQTLANVVADNPKINNTFRVQDLVAKFIFNLKTAVYRTKAQQGKLSELLYVQEFVPNTQDGLKWYLDLFSESSNKPQSTKQAAQESAKTLLHSIDQTSFEDNFLLQIVLGSRDTNPGNTLFADAANAQGHRITKMYSIDHELIMPENNYDVSDAVGSRFPLRLWLAGLPQANVAFSRGTILKTLNLLDVSRLLAYHRQKKLFPPAAVSAQIERIQLIRNLFEAELQKPTPTLTPKDLFLKLVKNHPVYRFLKNKQGLSDLSTFICLGYIPREADIGSFRYHLGLASKQNLYFFRIVNNQVAKEKTNAAGFAILDGHSQQLACV